MRTAFLLALVFVACTVRPAVTEMTTIAQGGYAHEEGPRRTLLVTSSEEFERAWNEKIGSGAMPTVDFSNGVVVILFAGMRNTGGWSVIPESVEIDGDTATVHASVKGAGGGKIVTQALTYPYAVIFISNRGVKNVEWPE